jgi:hypothetical protein
LSISANAGFSYRVGSPMLNLEINEIDLVVCAAEASMERL